MSVKGERETQTTVPSPRLLPALGPMARALSWKDAPMVPAQLSGAHITAALPTETA